MFWEEEQNRHIWYPYFGKNVSTVSPMKVKSAKGSCITFEDGRVLIDGISSWWSVCHGYGHPHITKCLVEQVRRLPHVMLAGLVHEGIVNLSKRLVSFAESRFDRVFFSDSGSVAVEVALKMAIQYNKNRYGASTAKKKILYFTNSYHGDTFATMAVSDSMSSLNGHFLDVANFEAVCRPIPLTATEIDEFATYVSEAKDEIVCCIVEPLVQCAGDFGIYPVSSLEGVCGVLKESGVLLVFDEIATGFYRTGKKFAFLELREECCPDIMTLSKAMTGGSVGMGATLVSDEVFGVVCSTPFMHGPTFMGNPLACSAALASLDLFETENYEEKLLGIGKKFNALLDGGALSTLNPRTLGAIFAVDLPSGSGGRVKEFIARDVDAKAFLRPMDDVLYMMPPLNISSEDLELLCSEFVRLCIIFAEL